MANDPNGALVLQKNVCDDVLARVTKLEEDKMLVLPENYAVENHLKAAWLVLQETTDKSSNSVLQVCTRESIANCLLDMVLQGLSVSKKQCYFVAYGNKLTLMRSYFGTVALAKRLGNIKTEPIANVVYKGDEFEYEIDVTTGLTHIVKHTQKMENIDNNNIIGAYAIVRLSNGQTQATIMSMQQIKNAWSQGATKGTSPAHTKFGEEMCKKTVIGRACKMVINSSDDAWLYDGKRDEMDHSIEREEIIKQAENAESVDIPEVAEYEEVTSTEGKDTPKESEAGNDLFRNEPPY